MPRKRKNCSNKSCHKRCNRKCINSMCFDHCKDEGFKSCSIHHDNKNNNNISSINGTKLRLSFELDNDIPSIDIIDDNWSPPCLQCGDKTNPKCNNALCDKHCLHGGKMECKYHEEFQERLDIWECARIGNIEELRKWIEEDNVDVNIHDTYRKSPLFYACWGSQVQAVQYLLRNGALDDPILKVCWWNTYNSEIRKLLEEHYEEQYCEKQVTKNSLKELSQDERENILLQPIVRYLHMVRRKGYPPVPNTARYDIEQLIPDDTFKAAFETIPTYNYETGNIEVKNEKSDDNILQNYEFNNNENINDVEELAFQTALSSLNNLRGSIKLVNDSVNNKEKTNLEKEAAKLCAWSLEELLDINSCKICFARMVDCILIPCGHLGFCMKCIQTINECPTCTTPIEKKVKVFRV